MADSTDNSPANAPNNAPAKNNSPPKEVPLEQLLDPKVKQAVDTICSGGTLGELRGLAPKDMEAIYGLAYNYYTHSQWQQAEKTFAFLCVYSHFDKRFWKGLAASRQMGKKYLPAADAYSYMAMCDIEDPEPHFQAARCLIAAKQTKRATAALDATIGLASKNPAFKELQASATQLKKALKAKG